MVETVGMPSLQLSGDVKYLPEDMTSEILLRLPVLSLLRFKSVCKSWYGLIDGSYFVKKHIHRHHHYTHEISVKDRNLLLPIPSVSNDPHPNTFILTSIQEFEMPIKKIELQIPRLRYSDYASHKVSMAAFDGIICMNPREGKNSMKYVSLFNPATKQSRVLPELSVSPIDKNMSVSVGFGLDVKTKDYKVVRLFTFGVKACCKNRIEVYTLSSDSWRIIDAAVPVDIVMRSDTFRPFQNGTSYCWWGANITFQKEPGTLVTNDLILCFDFSSELLRTVDIPDAIKDNKDNVMRQVAIVNDYIACISCDGLFHLEIWVLNGYGSSVNESWVLHIKVDNFFQNINLWAPNSLLWFSMDGKYVFFHGSGDLFGFDEVCRYDLVTNAVKKHRAQQFFDVVKDHRAGRCILENLGLWLAIEFKESLLSVGGGLRRKLIESRTEDI